MAFYYDSYYANTPAKKVRTQPKRECNNLTYIYMNRDKRTIHNEPQYEARHEATKQNMFGLIGNQKTYEASLQRETIQYESVQIVDATKRSELKGTNILVQIGMGIVPCYMQIQSYVAQRTMGQENGSGSKTLGREVQGRNQL